MTLKPLATRIPKELALSIIILLLIGIVIVGRLFLSHQPQEGFGIYLLDTSELVILDEDIASYNMTSHEIKLTSEGVEKIRALKVPVTGSPFVIKINGKAIYWVILDFHFLFELFRNSNRHSENPRQLHKD